jgi:hypothetical protein
LGEDARRLLREVPATHEARSEWLRQLAQDEIVVLYLVSFLGGRVDQLDVPFECLLHRGCWVTLTRGGNGQIVYRDPSLASSEREYQTIPELGYARRTGVPRRLKGWQLALWSVRLLYRSGLIRLPEVAVPDVSEESGEHVRQARDGFELLIRCRWFLEPDVPVTYTRHFVETWCGIPRSLTRSAIFGLIQQQVIRKVGEAPSNYKRPASLYLPGEQRPA